MYIEKVFGLPINTEMRKQLPKKAIFAKCDLTPKQRDAIDADISRIDIVGYVSPDTIPQLKAGEQVGQFYLFTAQLKQKDYTPKNIEQLFRAIPQRFLLALQYEDKTQLVVYHTQLVSSPWFTTEDVYLTLEGHTLDSVWDNLVAHVGNITIAEGNNLVEQIAADKEKAKIEAQIAVLRKQLAKEKQLTLKMEINNKIKELNNKIKH